MTLCKSEQHFKLYIEEDRRINKIKQWFSKWDRTIAAVTAAVVFCTIVVLVIVKIKCDDDDKENFKKNEKNEMGFETMPLEISVLSESSCQVGVGLITCDGGTIDDICGSLNCSKKCETPISLDLQSFTLSKIEEGWLSCSSYLISNLTIGSNMVIDYNKGAFSGSPFSSTLNDLVLNSDIFSVKKGLFENSSIKTLQIQCDNFIQFEENPFGDVAYSLSSLSILNCLGEISALKNIVGSEETLISLKFLDLRFNNFANLNNDSLQAIPNVEILYLSFCKINTIEEGTFEKMQGLKILDLSNNVLKTLPEGIFQRQWRGISITNNKWNCNCDLMWLRDFNDNYPECFGYSIFMCATNEGFKPYTDVDFCPTTTSSITTKSTTQTSTSHTTSSPTSSSTTTTQDPTTASSTTTETTLVPTTNSTTETTFSTGTSTTETTASTERTSTESSTGTTTSTTITSSSVSPTPPDPETVIVQCIEPTNVDTTESDIQAKLELQNETVTLNFLLVHNQVYVEVTGNTLNASFLLWYDTHHKASCANISDHQTQIPFDFLKNETYIFCVIKGNNSLTSPFDCGAISLNQDSKPSFWESNKTSLILGFCGSLVVASLITAITAFYCIRQHPSLLKGNKRVIIVESEAADAIVMPQTYYNEINYNPPSLVSRASGYLTPAHHGVYGAPRFVPHLRTISEDVYPVPLYQVRKFYPNRYKRRTVIGCQPCEEHLYEAPPLPPNHPSEIRFRTNLGRGGCSQI